MSQTEVQLIKDAVIVNADVSGSAAIDVSKISGALPAAGGTITGDVTFDGETAGRDIVFDRSDNSLEFADNAKARFGNGADLEIYHTSTQNYLSTSNGNIELRHTVGGANEALLKAIPDGAVELYYDGSKKFETTSTGVTVTGNIAVTGTVDGADIAALSTSVAGKIANVVEDTTPQLGGNLDCNNKVVTLNDSTGSDNNRFKIGNGGDLQIYHDSNHSYINDSGSGLIKVVTSGFQVRNAADDETLIYAVQDSSVSLYYDNSKKFETTSGGARVLGFLNVNTGIHITDGGDSDSSITIGASNDLRLFHDGTDSVIRNNTGDFEIRGAGTGVGNILLRPKTSENGVIVKPDNAVELYFDDAKKAETNADGFRVSGALQSSSGNGNYYLRTQHTTIQEGGNSVTITLTGLTFSWGVFRIGGYASAGQASVSLHILFGGYMTHIANYNATVLANHAQGSSISLTKNNSSYVITITNNANNYDLFCNMMIESANSAFTMTLS